MPFLKVDTAVVVEVGPLIDNSDFKTLETAVAHDAAGMSVDLLKSSGSALAKVDLTPTSGGANDWTHKGNGVYELELTAAQNDTAGTLRVVGVADGVLPFESPVYTVVPANVYDSLIAGSDKMHVDDGTAGPGAKTTTHTIYEDDGVTPIEGCAVWITTDEAGNNVVAGTKYTDTNGQVTFLLDDGAYYRWKQKGGHEFTNPTAFTVS